MDAGKIGRRKRYRDRKRVERASHLTCPRCGWTAGESKHHLKIRIKCLACGAEGYGYSLEEAHDEMAYEVQLEHTRDAKQVG